MIVDLDDGLALDPARVGAKAAWLAKGLRAGLPILPGFVVDAAESGPAMRAGAEALERRGPGGAQLVVSALQPASADEIRERAATLGEVVVTRSSTSLEASGRFSGAFTSYLDLAAADAPRGVAGCWASAFSASAQGLLSQSGVAPETLRMPVLVQRALDPDAGGTATVGDDGEVTVVAVKGAPGGLLQGWEAGAIARFDGAWAGNELVEMVGTGVLDDVAAAIVAAKRAIGANRCEWAAADGRVWLLQVGASRPETPALNPFEPVAVYGEPEMVAAARVVTRAPGPLGTSLVLPWALGGLPGSVDGEPGPPDLDRARALCSQLSAEVWDRPAARSGRIAGECLRALRSGSPERAMERIRRLRPPDPARAAEMMSLLAGVRLRLVDSGAAPDPESAWFLPMTSVEAALAGTGVAPAVRVGAGVWEPFLYSVARAAGVRRRGTPASGGIGAGVAWRFEPGVEAGSPPRTVVSAAAPTPGVAPLLWDATALVTATGGPAAHLFDAARAIGVPAVSGVDLPVAEGLAAVDGHAGVVSWLDWSGVG